MTIRASLIFKYYWIQVINKWIVIKMVECVSILVLKSPLNENGKKEF